MAEITVLAFYDRISCFHTLRPFLLYGDQKQFHYTNSLEYCLKRDKNRILIMVRWFLKPDVVDLEVLKRLREKYERIVFFHGTAGGGVGKAEVLPYVDLFYQKALLKDRSLYARPFYGKELYSDYSHREFGIEDPNPIIPKPIEDDDQLKKLRLLWNIGVGQFPKRTYLQRSAVASARMINLRLVRAFYSFPKRLHGSEIVGGKRDIPVHARLGLVHRASMAHHRQLILEQIEGDQRFVTGKVPQRQYNRELGRSRMVLSPFGWGELCFRDFEAVLSGAVLLKPDMSHIETWPDVFRDGETYIGFRWDAGNLLEKAEAVLEDESLRKDIAENAYNAYYDQIGNLHDRFEAVLHEITELKQHNKNGHQYVQGME